MKTSNKRTNLVELGFPAWVQVLTPVDRKKLAELGRIRLLRSNPITARIALSDDVAIANLLFNVADKATLYMLMDAYDLDSTLWDREIQRGAS